MAMRLRDQVVIITGGSRGIGRAIALACAREGAHIVIAARNEKAMARVAGEVQVLGREALAVPTDVTDEAQVARLVERTLSHFERVDILVNSAGVSILAPIHETSLADWETTIAVNMRGTFLCCRAVWEPMMKQGYGVILNISSGSGKRGHANWSVYTASKFGVLGLSSALSKEGIPLGIRVNTLCPGPTNTDMRHANFPDEDPATILQPEELTNAALFLLTDPNVRGVALDVRKLSVIP